MPTASSHLLAGPWLEPFSGTGAPGGGVDREGQPGEPTLCLGSHQGSRRQLGCSSCLLRAGARGGAVARLPEPGGRGRQPLLCGLPQGLTPGAQEHLVDEVAHSPCTLGPAHVAPLVGHKPSTWPQVTSTGPGTPACSRQPTAGASEATAATRPLQCPRHSIKTSMGFPTLAACSPALGLGGTRSWGSQVPTPQRNMESVLFCMDVKALKHLGPGRKGAR